MLEIHRNKVVTDLDHCRAWLGWIDWRIIQFAAAAKSLQSCDSVRPHRRQPTRLPRPWDSPGKNTGVGCHFLLQFMKVKSESEVAQSCLTLSNPHGLQPTTLLHPWDFLGKSTGVGCHCLLQILFGKYCNKTMNFGLLAIH